MSTRAATFQAEVLRREPLSEHLVRLVLGGPGLAGFASTGIADEWVGLVVPGQFQSRYYTVRSWDAERGELVLDVVVHEHGLVTEWAARDCTGEAVTITEPKGSFDPPPDAGWWLLVGDLTALPAMARASASAPDGVRVLVHAEVPERPAGYLSDTASVEVTWVPGAGDGLADALADTTFPEGPGYVWMAGESAQMRAVRRHLMRDRGLPSTAYDCMGYWRATAGRQPRAVDPGPIWRAGKAAGKSDAEIWADYDAARDTAEQHSSEVSR